MFMIQAYEFFLYNFCSKCSTSKLSWVLCVARKKYKGMQHIPEISDSDHLLFSMTGACPAALHHHLLWLRLQAWHLQPSKQRVPL